jgi:hypothetical protein
MPLTDAELAALARMRAAELEREFKWRRHHEQYVAGSIAGRLRVIAWAAFGWFAVLWPWTVWHGEWRVYTNGILPTRRVYSTWAWTTTTTIAELIWLGSAGTITLIVWLLAQRKRGE